MKKVRVIIKDNAYVIPDNKEEYNESFIVNFSVNQGFKLLQGFSVPVKDLIK